MAEAAGTTGPTGAAGARWFGQGPLSRIAAAVYTVLVVDILLLLSCLPGLAALMLLERAAGNIPIAALCALPVGPAVSAAVYALRHRSYDITDLAPAKAYWRGYRLNLTAVLRIWVPWLALASVIALNLVYFEATGLPGWWVPPLVMVGLGATMWVINALVITSLFTFRTLDIARLGLYFLFRTPVVVLGNAGLLAVAAGITVLWSELVLAVVAAVLVLGLLGTCRPMIAAIHSDFVA